MKKFFNKKLFYIDKSGKSPALYLKKEMEVLDKKLINQLKIFSKKNHFKDSRICMHSSKSAKIQNMINIIYKKKNKNIFHKHLFKDEVYQIIKGQMKIIFVKRNKKKSVILGKDNLIFRIKKNTFHQILPLSKFVIFHEIREGPFFKNDSIFKKLV